MDSEELKEEIKQLLRERCDELGIEYFDNEDSISKVLIENAKQKSAQEAEELAKLKLEIQERKRTNLADLNTQTESIK